MTVMGARLCIYINLEEVPKQVKQISVQVRQTDTLSELGVGHLFLLYKPLPIQDSNGQR